jgi:hypothetical protein
VALEGLNRSTTKVSSASSVKSPTTLTVTVLSVSPGANVRVPLVVLESLPAVAVTSEVAGIYRDGLIPNLVDG